MDQRKLLDVVLKADMELRREADIQQLLVVKEEQEEWSSSLDQEDPEPPHIKEEQEELCTSQEGEQLQGLEEADITKFPFTHVSVKSEDDDEEEPQSSQFHQRQTEQMETEADGEDCGEPEPARNSDPERHLQPDKVPVSDFRCRFSCSECGKRFGTKGTLKEHMRTHTGEKPFSCSVCKKSFTQRGSLGKHMRIHTGEKLFRCSICKKAFTGSGNLQEHKRTHTIEKPFSCSACGKAFIKSGDLKKHMRTHTVEKSFSCSVCKESFTQSGDLRRHKRTHTVEKPFSCSACGKAFSESGNLKGHIKTTGEKSCSVCDQRFSWLGDFQQLLMSQEEVPPERQEWSSSLVQEDPEPPHIKEEQEELWISQEGEQLQGLEEADIIKFPFSPVSVKSEDDDEEKPQSSQLHQRQTEQMETEADGEDCGGPEPARNSDPDRHPEPDTDDKTDSSSELDDSVDIEFWKNTRKHQPGFTYQRNKKVSVNDGYNTGDKPFSCSDDKVKTEPKTDDFVDARDFSKQIRQPQSGPNHLNTEEVSVSDTRCNIDKKPFSSSEDGHTLLTHKKSPTGEKPFGCSVCGQTFDKHESLSSHMTCHNGEKPFCCSVCNAGFSDSEALVQHMRIHTRQTQFICRICGEEFAWRRYLTKHMEVHKIYRCNVCDQSFAWYYQLKYHKCVGRQPSQLHQTQTEENREAEPPASSSTEQMKTEPDGEDCGGPEPARNSDPDTVDKTGDCSEPETDDSEDWKEPREPQSGLNSLNNDEVPVSDERCNAGEKPFSCCFCGKRFFQKENLKKHIRIHTGEKPFSCSVCGKQFGVNGNLKRHMRTHTGEKPFSCSVCKRSFAERTYLKKHMRIHRGETIELLSV